jgi:hypothetical protein
MNLFYHICMKSHRLSDGKYCQFQVSTTTLIRKGRVFPLTLGLVALLITGCATESMRSSEPKEEEAAEVSLKEDQLSIQELRERNVPEDRRRENDELKEILLLTGALGPNPNRVRSRWRSAMRKKREVQRKAQKRQRDEFTKRERKARDSFLADQKKKRETFRDKSKHMDREGVREFYKELDVQRKDFFASQREQRKEFESKLRQENKDFHYNMRERDKEFNEAYRDYYKRFQEKKREDRLEKQRKRREALRSKRSGRKTVQRNYTPEEKALMEEFDKMEQIPGSRLAPDDE